MINKLVRMIIGEKKPYRWVVNRMKQREENYPIVCTFCFEKYEADAVLFRAARYDNSSPETALQLDPVLSAFWERRGVESAEIGEQNPVLDPANYPESSKKYRNGVIISLEDKFGHVTYNRICPLCHNALPKSAGCAPSNIISIIGGTSVGKTVYTAMLIDVLQKHTQNAFGASCIELSSGMRKLGEFEELRKRILNDTHKGTDRSYVRPYLFRFAFEDRTIPELTLCFYDFPGEAIRDQDFLQIEANHIAHASGVILLVDPLQFEVVAKKLGLDIIEKAVSPKQVLANLYEAIIGHQENASLETPTAVVFTKSDELRVLSQMDNAPVRENSNIFQKSEHPGFLDLDQVNNISNDVTEFAKGIDHSFFQDIKTLFANFRFFAVSALGYSPVNSEVKAEPQPCRVDEPFLWLLYQFGYIKGRERNV